MKKITLITGGARSGKSSFALNLAEEKYNQRAFIATATALDEEMKTRILNHQKERGDKYHTIEEPYDLQKAIRDLPAITEVAVIDCITVWLGNLYYKCNQETKKIDRQVGQLLDFLADPPCDLIIVTNELGAGIIPENKLARIFRDFAGQVNTSLAHLAFTVYICFCGIPQQIK